MDIVIAEAVRSAVGRGFKGALAQKRPDELAADVFVISIRSASYITPCW